MAQAGRKGGRPRPPARVAAPSTPARRRTDAPGHGVGPPAPQSDSPRRGHHPTALTTTHRRPLPAACADDPDWAGPNRAQPGRQAARESCPTDRVVQEPVPVLALLCRRTWPGRRAAWFLPVCAGASDPGHRPEPAARRPGSALYSRSYPAGSGDGPTTPALIWRPGSSSAGLRPTAGCVQPLVASRPAAARPGSAVRTAHPRKGQVPSTATGAIRLPDRLPLRPAKEVGAGRPLPRAARAPALSRAWLPTRQRASGPLTPAEGCRETQSVDATGCGVCALASVAPLLTIRPKGKRCRPTNYRAQPNSYARISPSDGLNTANSVLPQPVGIRKWQQTRNYQSNQSNSSLSHQSSSTFIPSTTLNTIGQMNVSFMRAMLWARKLLCRWGYSRQGLGRAS